MSSPESHGETPVALPVSSAHIENSEPPFVKPHHVSDIDFWKFPDRNYYVFVCLSFLLGFFGLDHFYLRSFGTGMQKFLINIFTFGFWYFWDAIQIIYDGEKVKKEGLTSPLDWIRGIGRGVFEDPIKKAADLKNPTADVIRSKKDILIYLALSMTLGIFGLDRFYVGQTWHGIAKICTCLNIFLFLFGWAWAIHDAVRPLFFTKDFIKDGVTTPFPFSMIVPATTISGEVFLLEKVPRAKAEKEAQEAKEHGVLGKPADSGPSMFSMDNFRFLYRELAVPLLKPTVGTAVETANKGAVTTQKAAAVGSEVAAAAPKIAGAVTTQLEAVANPSKLMAQIQAAAANKAAERTEAAHSAVKGAVGKIAHHGGGLLEGLLAVEEFANEIQNVATAATAAQEGGMLAGSDAVISNQSGGGIVSLGTSAPIIAGTLTAVTLAGAVKVIIEVLSQNKK